MGPEFDGDVAVAFDVEVGVMGVLFGDAGALVKELKSGHKVLHGPLFTDPLAAVGEAPAVELLELLAGLFGRVRGDASFAGEAFLLAEFAGGLGRHCRVLLVESGNAAVRDAAKLVAETPRLKRQSCRLLVECSFTGSLAIIAAAAIITNPPVLSGCGAVELQTTPFSHRFLTLANAIADDDYA